MEINRVDSGRSAPALNYTAQQPMDIVPRPFLTPALQHNQLISALSLPVHSVVTDALQNGPVFLAQAPDAMEIIDDDVTSFSALPAELIYHIQCFCLREDELALSAINKALFTMRFYGYHLQDLHFKTAAEVTQLLSYCQRTQQMAIENPLRRPEDFRGVKILTLTLSDQLTAEQCTLLFSYLPEVINLSIDIAAEQSAASLSPLLKAAHQLNLKQLTIAKPRYQKVDPTLHRFEDFLPDELWQWTALEILELHNLANIQYISERMGDLRKLQSIKLVNMPLETLPDGLWILDRLESLVLEKLKHISEIPENIGQLQALKILKLIDIKHLKALPKNLWGLGKLEKLILSKLKKLAELPEQIGQLNILKSLELHDLWLLRTLPKSLGLLTKLEHLVVNYVMVQEIPTEIGQLKALTSLELKSLFWLQHLPNNLWNLDKLERLVLRDLRITTLPGKMHNLRALKSLALINMIYLNTLPKSLGDLYQLEKLVLIKLERLKEISEQIGQLQALTLLDLDSLDELRTLPMALSTLPNLRQIIITHMPRLRIPPALKQYTTVNE